MTEQANFKTEELHLHANQFNVIASETFAAHTAAHGALEASSMGLGPASKAAITEGVGELHTDSVNKFQAVSEHAEKFRTAATQYTTTDEGESAKLDASASALSLAMGI